MSAGIVHRGPCKDLPCKLAWDKTFRFTRRKRGSYTSKHPRVKRTVTKAFTIVTSSAATAAAATADDDECQHFGTSIANKLRNYFPPTRNKVQHKISHIRCGPGAFWCFILCLHFVTSIPGFLSPHSFLCCWFRRRNSEWSDAHLNCANWSSVIKSALLVTHFVSLFEPIDFMCKTISSVQYTTFHLYVFHQCLNNSFTHTPGTI